MPAFQIIAQTDEQFWPALVVCFEADFAGVRNWPLAVITCVPLRPEAVVKLGQAIPCGGSK